MNCPFDLMVAPNGARLGKADHPAIPLSKQELAETAVACAAAGATGLHLHVRDKNGCHSIDPTQYSEAISTIRSQTDIHIQISTEAAGVFDTCAQRHCLKTVPASDASISLKEIARAPDAFVETYALAAERSIDVQHILYSPKEVAQLLRHFETGDIPEQSRRAIFVLGRYTANQCSSPADLTPFLTELGDDVLNWSVCAFGAEEQQCLLAALDHGGNVRIGFENNRTAPDGQPFEDNAASVASFVMAAKKAGFAPRKKMS